MRCSIWRIFIFMSFKLFHVRMLSVVLESRSLQYGVWENLRSNRVSEWVYLTFSYACFSVLNESCMNFDLLRAGVRATCTIWCVCVCVNTHSQFRSHTLISELFLPATPFAHSFLFFFSLVLFLSFDTHSVMLFCWFEKFTFTLKWHITRVLRTQIRTPCNNKKGKESTYVWVGITFRIRSLCDDQAANWNRNLIELFLVATVEFDLLILNHCMYAS